jgi:hypothetical protein
LENRVKDPTHYGILFSTLASLQAFQTVTGGAVAVKPSKRFSIEIGAKAEAHGRELIEIQRGLGSNAPTGHSADQSLTQMTSSPTSPQSGG